MKWWYWLILELLIIFGVMAWVYFFPSEDIYSDFGKGLIGSVLIYAIEKCRDINRRKTMTSEELDRIARAEEIAKDIYIHYFDDDINYPCVLQAITAGFQKGDEYGYKKALEEATHNYNAIIADYDKRIAELEKENAELKDEMEAKQVVLNDFKSRVETVTDRFNRKSSQLTKAKELLKRWVDDKVTISEQKDLIADTEQFLNGEVENV